jgi:hypothetical protein
MSYFQRNRRVVQPPIKKVEPVLKDGTEPMQQSAQANDASSQAYQSQAPQAGPPMNDQIKAHLAAAKAHYAADDAHRKAGKTAMQDTPQVGNAHFQQAKSHFNQAQSHEGQARDMQDQKDCGYR